MNAGKHTRFVAQLALMSLGIATGCNNAALATSAAPGAHGPDPLYRLRVSAEARSERGEKPIVIFDLDDTLFDTRHRALSVFQELAADSSFARTYPLEATRLSKLRVPDIRYHVEDTLELAGITAPTLVAKIRDYWVPRFFSQRCGKDVPLPGAAAYVRKLVSAGALVLYLTGRDEPRMGAGTELALLRNGFPLSARARLIMRESADLNEFEFKLRVFEWARTQGTVIAGFENEPKNINALQKAFPEAAMFFLDTQHSRSPERPNAGIEWLSSYLIPGRDQYAHRLAITESQELLVPVFGESRSLGRL